MQLDQVADSEHHRVHAAGDIDFLRAAPYLRVPLGSVWIKALESVPLRASGANGIDDCVDASAVWGRRFHVEDQRGRVSINGLVSAECDGVVMVLRAARRHDRAIGDSEAEKLGCGCSNSRATPSMRAEGGFEAGCWFVFEEW